jgi:uncharacterized RDD family membrane protein YckC
MDWYYIDSSKPEGKRRNGPWSARQMLLFAEQGAFLPETLVWRDGLENWRPWNIIGQELKTEFQAETIKQVIEERILPNITVSKANYASLGLRFCAFIIDFVLLQLLFILLTPIHAYLGILSEGTPQTTQADLMPTFLFVFMLMFFYAAFFTKNFSGTPGKIALGLAIVRHNGKPMTWSCAFLRSFVAFFSYSFFGAGCLLAAFDIEKRALHDYIADTRVLKLQRAQP